MPEPLQLNPITLDAEAVLNQTTQKWPGWWDNCATNMGIIRAGKNLAAIPKRTGPAIVVGAGPSTGIRELKLIREYRQKLTVISTDKMLKALIQVGVEPDFVATVDGDSTVADFYNFKQLQGLSKYNVTAILNVVTTHPETARMAYTYCKDVYWFNSFFDDPQAPTCSVCKRVSPTAGFYFMSNKKQILQALGNVGALCWHLAYFLGCSPVILIGMDYSYKAGTPIETTHYYDAYLKIAAQEHIGTPPVFYPSQQEIEQHVKACLKCKQRVRDTYKTETNPDFQQDYLIDKIWGIYRELLMPFILRAKCRTVNCSGGALHGPRISGMQLEAALAKFC